MPRRKLLLNLQLLYIFVSISDIYISKIDMKILISWIAFNNDFKNGEPNEDGPTMQFHEYFYNYDKHLLLATGDDPQLGLLQTALKRKYPERVIEPIVVGVEDVIDLKEVKTKVEKILVEHNEHEIDIFFSPGTSIMQLAWFLCHTSLELKTKLIQTRPGKYSKARKPEKIYLEIDASTVPKGAIIKESHIIKSARYESLDDYKLTPAIQEVYGQASLTAQTDNVTTLIYGSTGTGKEHLAKFIHQQSIRKNKPFLAINCSALADQLLESRLFGFKKGTFTGATSDTKGLFEQADGGTIFLDEIGDISGYMQQSLLRVLQEKEIQPIGGKAKVVNVRVIAATNKDLALLCSEGKFRWDLYYRLAVVELQLPTLVERGKNEIKELIQYFIKLKKQQLAKGFKLEIKKETMDYLTSYTWPGNVRELENVIENLYVLEKEKVSISDLPDRLKKSRENDSLKLADVEQRHIQKVLKIHNGNQRQTAITLGIAVNTLKRIIKSNNL